jgi:RNA polymerase sigma-70 factor, ECF subfamily
MVTQEILDTTQCSVAELVRLAQEGDSQAQGTLYVRYFDSCVATAARLLRSHEEAEELVQDVFIHAFERLDQLRTPEAFGGWLRQIVRRMAINRITRRKVSYGVDQELLETLRTTSTTPLDNALHEERRQQVQAGLEKLGSTDRRTLEAFYMDGQSLIEMSEDFAAPLGTIKRRLHVARKRLAQELEPLQAI